MSDQQEEQERPTEKLISIAHEMIDTYRDLAKLTVVENLSLGVSLSVTGIVLLVFICFVVLFGALGLAWWIGESMNNMKAGFFIAGSAFMLILLIILLSMKKGMVPWIRNVVIKYMYEGENK